MELNPSNHDLFRRPSWCFPTSTKGISGKKLERIACDRPPNIVVV
ncbi:hypothetical protein OROGR_010060 [Orobanche gracilis]